MCENNCKGFPQPRKSRFLPNDRQNEIFLLLLLLLLLPLPLSLKISLSLPLLKHDRHQLRESPSDGGFPQKFPQPNVE